jgi:hypothetical protein
MVERVGNIPDDVVLQARLDILYGQTPNITIKAHELPEESEPTVEKSGTLAKPVFNIGIPQAMGAVAAREYAKQAETARDAAILAGETAKEELNGIVASADDALDQKIAETGTLLDEKVATAAQRASEAASSAVAAAQKATAAEQAMQGAQAAQAQAEQSAQEAADSAAMSKDWAAGQPVTYSGAPVSIAYAGANRIDALTLYGENVQGGTTEAPVALTGVDSAILFEQHTPINLAKPITADRYGVSVITNADGSVTVKGTATDETWPRLVEVNIPSAIIAGDITISLSSPASVKMKFQAMTPDGRKESYGLSAGSTSITVKIKSGYTGMHIFLSLLPDQTIDETFHIMIAQGTEPVPFVPYVEPSITHLPIPRPLHKVGDVRDICRTRVKSIYDKRIVLDGSLDEAFIQTNIIDGWIQIATESDAVIPESTSIVGSIKSSYLKAYAIEEVYSKKHSGISVDSNRRIRLSFKTSEYPDVTSVETARTYLSAHPLTVYYQSTAYYGTNGLDVCLTEYQTDYIESYADESITTAWISSTGALSTGAEIAYVLSSPETYATEPLDFDNAAGPLTVMTGGELEVRMTELIGSRGDVSNNTVAFSEAAQDADIQTGEKLSVLFGKIKKRFSVVNKLVNGAVYPNLLDNSNFTNPVNQRGEGAYYANGYIIDRWINNGSSYNVAEHYMASGSPDGTKYIFQPLELSKVAKTGDSLTASANINGETISVTAKITTAKGASDVVSTSDGKASIGFSWNPADDRMYFRINDLIESGAVFLNWAKLEKGSVATPYVPKGYGAELAECMRYYQKIAFSVGQDRSTYKYIPTLIPMRVAPTCTLQQISSSGVQPTISTSNLYITANLVAPQYFDGFAYLSADL